MKANRKRTAETAPLAPTEVTDLYDCPKTIGRPRLPTTIAAPAATPRPVSLPGRVENDVTSSVVKLTPGQLALVDWLIDQELAAWSAE